MVNFDLTSGSHLKMVLYSYHAETDWKSLDAFWIATIRKETTDIHWVEAKNVVQRSNNTKKIT